MVTAKKASTPPTVTVAAPAVAKPVAAKKPAAKKAAAPAMPAAVTAATAVPVKSSATAKQIASQAKPAAPIGSKPALSAEQRNHYVEVAAFYIAERRGFVPGNPGDDWCAAELEVDRLIASGHFN